MYVFVVYNLVPEGVSIHPMCMVMELAPMGSLFALLDKKVEHFKAAQEDVASACLRMPGGVLGHDISTRIALQVTNFHFHSATSPLSCRVCTRVCVY